MGSQRRREHRRTYDLVIVGGGLSGLSAAYYFIRDAGRSCKVLILDNHDDFGGHAKRNEFHYDGRLLALNGGTLNIESWNRYNEHARAVLHDIGIDIDRFLATNEKNHGLYRSLGLVNQATFFDKETWGVDRLVIRHGCRRARQWLTAPTISFSRRSPPQAQKDMLRLYGGKHPDYLPGLSSAEKKVRLAKMSYQDFLLNFVKVDRQVRLVLPQPGRRQLLRRCRLFPGALRVAGRPSRFLGHEPRAEPQRTPGRPARRSSRTSNRAGRWPYRPFPRWQRDDCPPADPMADARRGSGQDDGGCRRGARGLWLARSGGADRSRPAQQHRRARAPRRRSRESHRGRHQLRARRQDVPGPFACGRHGVLEHVHSVPRSRPAREPERGARRTA